MKCAVELRLHDARNKTDEQRGSFGGGVLDILERRAAWTAAPGPRACTTLAQAANLVSNLGCELVNVRFDMLAGTLGP